MNLAFIFQAAPAAGANGGLLQLAPYLLMFVVFYFVLIAPMRKQQKKTKEMLSTLKKGDRVVTTGGIYGTLAQVEDQIVWMKLNDQLKIKLNRSAIAGLATDQDTAKEPTA